LTPTGYRPLADMRPGNEVFPWDPTTERPTLNHVAGVSASALDTSYGLHKGLLMWRAIEVTQERTIARFLNFRRCRARRTS